MRPKNPRRRGAAAVELALLLPLLAFLFVISVDYARIFYCTMIVTNCARSGALYASQNPTTANDATNIVAEAARDAPDLIFSDLRITSTTDSAANPTWVAVTVTYPFSTITNFPGINRTTQLTRTVRMDVAPWTPNP